MSAEAREYLDFVLFEIRTLDYYASGVDWAPLRRGADERAAGAQVTSDVYPAIEWVLEALGDGHGFLIPPDRLDDLERSLRRIGPVPSAHALGRVAVLELPSFGRPPQSPAAHRYVSAAWRALRTTPAACGWIVDLRNDLGGDMYPMLAAVGPLIREPRPIGFLNASGGLSWVRVAGGGVWPAMSPAVGVDFGDPRSDIPGRRAVMIGPRTVSAGEATLVALLSGRRARTFGSPNVRRRRISEPDGATGRSGALGHRSRRRRRLEDGVPGRYPSRRAGRSDRGWTR